MTGSATIILTFTPRLLFLFPANNSKFLSDFGIRNGSRLQSDDFLQDYTLLVNVLHTYVLLITPARCSVKSAFLLLWRSTSEWISVLAGSEELERDVEFEVVGEAPDKAPPPQSNQEEVKSITNGNKDSAQPSTSSKGGCKSSSVHI